MKVSRGAYMVLVGNLRERDYLEDLGIGGMIILKYIIKTWTESMGLRVGAGGGLS
jgi:hypothetical protein